MTRIASETMDGAAALPVYTVGEISQALKTTLEESFPWVRVRGEITGFKRATSGHLYFSLKDADAVLDAACWRGTAGGLAVRPEDGIEVIATGRITTYPGRSRYQLVVDALERAGEGALLKLLEERKKKLAAEGLFAEDRKKPIPFLPDVIGVVTSPTGAVIRDILHRIRERFPRRVIVWPVLVQGEGAAGQIAAAIEGFNRLPPRGPVPKPDVLIVARGGGSLEDLWAFNEEIVVRAAAASRIPLIAAVGHETDVTLIDFAADRRAPTPTAAAEMAVPVRMELLGQTVDLGARLVLALKRIMGESRVRLEGLARGLPNLRRLAEDMAQRLDEWSERLANATRTGLRRRRSELAELAGALLSPRALVAQGLSRLQGEARALRQAVRAVLADRHARLRELAGLLESFSYEQVLERGFALVSDGGGAPVTAAAALAPGMDVTMRFHDGSASATVGSVAPESGGAAPPARRKARRASSTDPRQGSLL